jgi:acetyl-CoA carboxylase carboxyltransferase component
MYFMNPASSAAWGVSDQRILRHAVPENRRRVYDMRRIVSILADSDSTLELRPNFGSSLLTYLVRMEGRACGIMASNPKHLGGAIDSDSAIKGARFLQLCDAFDLPLISIVDTPGFMVGPEAEKTGQVRKLSRLFVAGASITIPVCSWTSHRVWIVKGCLA